MSETNDNSSPIERLSAFTEARRSAALLAFFAVITTALLATAERGLRHRIDNNAEAALLQTLNAILPPNRYDNNIATSRITLAADKRLGLREPAEGYVATRNGRVVAFVLPTVAPKGYSGPIHLLTGIYRDGSIAGVRVVSHKETPGLGDKIERRKSAWVDGFTDKKIGSPSLERWSVKKDGGEFDQLTGATITPRAVVSAVRDALQYYNSESSRLRDVYKATDKKP